MTADQDQTAQTVEKLHRLSENKRFLGSEFLTWLWFSLESRPQGLTLNENLIVDLWIDDLLVLEAEGGHGHLSKFSGGNPSASAEASAALGNGKTVKEMKLGMNISGFGEFISTLQGRDLFPRSLHLPEISDKEGLPPEAITLHRIKATEVFLQALDELFKIFLSERSSEEWNKLGLDNIRKWVGERTGRVLH